MTSVHCVSPKESTETRDAAARMRATIMGKSLVCLYYVIYYLQRAYYIMLQHVSYWLSFTVGFSARYKDFRMRLIYRSHVQGVQLPCLPGQIE